MEIKAVQNMKRKPSSKDAGEGGKSQKHEAPLEKKKKRKKNEEEEAVALDIPLKQIRGCCRCSWSWKGCIYCHPNP